MMRMQLSLLLALTLSGPFVFAGTSTPGPIKLDNQKTSGQSVSGTCGPATVKVSDTTEDRPMDPSGFSGSYGAISIGSGKSALTISPQTDSGSGIFLQDRNKLHCLSSPTGPKLVLAMICHARSCAPIDYRVIDPKTTKVISKQDNMDECDAICATKALGAPLPAGLTDIP